MKPNILTLSKVNDNLFWYSKHHPIVVGDTTVQLSSHGLDGIKCILGEHINIEPEYITLLTILEYLTTLHALLAKHQLHAPHVNNIVYEIYREFGDNPPIDNVIYYYINRITMSGQYNPETNYKVKGM